jgi:hypothetical protein
MNSEQFLKTAGARFSPDIAHQLAVQADTAALTKLLIAKGIITLINE